MDTDSTPNELTPEELAAETAEPLPERAAMSTLTLSGLDAAAGTVEAVGDGVSETVAATDAPTEPAAPEPVAAADDAAATVAPTEPAAPEPVAEADDAATPAAPEPVAEADDAATTAAPAAPEPVAEADDAA